MSNSNLDKEKGKYKREGKMSDKLELYFDRQNHEVGRLKKIRNEKRFRIKHRNRAFDEDFE